MIEIRNVTKTFGSFAALDDASLTVPSGAIYGLVGPNGAGKSTLIRCLTGIYRQDKGDILVDGHPVYENPQLKARIASIPGDLIVRSDALEACGWPELNSASDWTAFLKEAMEKLPETNGQPTIGLTTTFAEAWGLQGIAAIGYEKGETTTADAGNNAVIWNHAENKFVDYFLNEDGTVSYVKINLGRRMGAEYEVLEGIEDGAKVVTGGQIRLKDGIKVTVNE